MAVGTIRRRTLAAILFLGAACSSAPQASAPEPAAPPGPIAVTSPATELAATPAATADWTTDFTAARQRAVGAGRPLLLAFVGSDWCPTCRILDRTVFATAEFAAWARANVVLVQLDFPRSHSLPEPLQQQNEGLRRKYRVGGYPGVLFVEPTSTKLMGVVPFTDRGAAAWIASADGVLAAAKPRFGLK